MPRSHDPSLPPAPPDVGRAMSLRAKLTAASAAAGLVLVVGALAYLGLWQYRRAGNSVEHTNVVRSALAQVTAQMAEAEAGARGYVITLTDDPYAAQYARAAAGARAALGAVRTLTADNPNQQRRLSALAPVLDRRLAVLAEYMADRRERGLAAAAAHMGLGRGRVLADSVRALVAAADQEEARLLAARDRTLVRRGRALDLILICGSLGAFALILLVIQAIRHDVLLREAAEQRVRAQAAELAAQAEQLEHQQAELEMQLEEQQVLTEELAQTNAELEVAQGRREALIAALARSNRDLDQFAYVASHDLKAPLRGISNLSSWIEEDLADVMTPEAREQMALLRGRVRRMEALIDGVLQYSRAGRAHAAPEPVDTGTLVREAVELLAPPSGARVEVADGMPTVVAERVPLQQVFLNLVGNALKYAGRVDPVVRVGWNAERPGWYRFSVADNGPGIAPQYHDRVFGIFQTLQSRDQVEGTGIGLSVVKKIVEGQGGRVWVESAEGAGATFHFTWPAAPAAGAGATAA